MLPALRLSAICVLCILCSALGAQTTISVPADQKTIQRGIDIANSGDTVLVAPGIYYENLDFKGKAILVVSSGTPTNTIIDGGSNGPAVVFQTSEPRAAVLSGFTIQNGGGYGVNQTAPDIAGLVIAKSSPTVRDNVITRNQCWGVRILSGAPLIERNTISATQSPAEGCGFGSGAGIYVGGNLARSANPTNGEPAILRGNTIEDNVLSGLSAATGNGGAGIAVWGGSPVIEGNIIRNNSSPHGSGGAIHLENGGVATILRNVMYGNSAGCGSGSVTFARNYPGPTRPVLIAYNTIADNMTVAQSAAVLCDDRSAYGLGSPNAVVVNNIISLGATETSIDCSAFPGPSEEFQSIFDHNLLFKSGDNFFAASCVDVSSRYGNLLADPQFVDASAKDYGLRPASPAVDDANKSALEMFNQRSGDASTQVDLGAYGHPGAVSSDGIFVALDVSTATDETGSMMPLTAHLTSPMGNPKGNVAFFMDERQIGVAAVENSMQGGVTATLPDVVPKGGSHSFYAAYAGQEGFAPAVSVVQILHIGARPATATFATNIGIYANQNPVPYGQSVGLNITVTSSDPTFMPSPITLSLNGGAVFATIIPTAYGVALYTGTFSLGLNTIQASYAGDATHQAATATLSLDIDNGIGTTMIMTLIPSTISVGQTALLSATVKANSGLPPTGTIDITDNGVKIATIPMTVGLGSFPYVGRTAGKHIIVATSAISGPYNGASSDSLAPTIETVLGLPSTSVLTANPTSGIFGSPITLTAAVSPTNPPGLGTPTGTVTFSDGKAIIGKADLSPSGIATLTTRSITTGGTPSVGCMYSGDSTYLPSNCNIISVGLIAAQSALTISASANNVPAFNPVTFNIKLLVNGQAPPTGSVIVLSVNNQLYSLGLNPDGTTGQVVSTLPPGIYNVTAQFSTTNLVLGSSASLTETIVEIPSTTILTASPNPAYVGQRVDLTAIVTVPNTLVPVGGTVSFYDGPTVLGTATLDQSRQAILTTSALAVGDHSLTASYPSGTGIIGSTSVPFTETILAAAFTLSLAPANITLDLTQPATSTIQLASIGGFAGPLTLTYGTLPAHLSATIDPTTVTLTAGGKASATLTLTEVLVASSPMSKRWPAIAFAALLLLIPLRARKLRQLRLLSTLVFAAALMQTFTGCTTAFYRVNVVAPGTYQIPITATDVTHNVQTANLTVVVNP